MYGRISPARSTFSSRIKQHRQSPHCVQYAGHLWSMGGPLYKLHLLASSNQITSLYKCDSKSNKYTLILFPLSFLLVLEACIRLTRISKAKFSSATSGGSFYASKLNL